MTRVDELKIETKSDTKPVNIEVQKLSTERTNKGKERKNISAGNA